MGLNPSCSQVPVTLFLDSSSSAGAGSHSVHLANQGISLGYL